MLMQTTEENKLQDIIEDFNRDYFCQYESRKLADEDCRFVDKDGGMYGQVKTF